MNSNVLKITRLRDWGKYLIPFWLGFAFLSVYINEIPFKQAIILISLLTISIIAMASYGYILNDFFDIEDDRKAGKQNSSKHLSKTTKIVYVIIFLVLALLPWLFLPFAYLNFGLFILQLLLLAMYPIPPIRLKKYVLTGVITDALYNSVVIVFVIIFTLFDHAGKLISNKAIILALLFCCIIP